MQSLFQDFRYGVRQLRRSPGFAAVAVITLAIGIGANTAIFSIVDASVLHPLPFRNASGIMTLWMNGSGPGAYSGPAAVSDPDSLEWRRRTSVFAQTAFFRWHAFNLTGLGDPVRLVGAEVSSSLFPLLEVNSDKGRIFLPEEEIAGKNKLVLLSHRLWSSRFAADSTVLGRSISLDGQFFTVIGVMPTGFTFPNEADFWVPVFLSADASNATLQFLARVKPGVSLESARNEAAAILHQLDQERHRPVGEGVRITLTPLAEVVGAELRSPMLVLLGAVGLLLLIGCTNVANLLLARAAARGQEIAIRNALGASRGRIVRQLLTESALIAALGGAFGVALAYAGHNLLIVAASALPRSIASPTATARIEQAGIDSSVLLFTFGLSVLTGILFGLAPVMQVSAPQPNRSLQQGNKQSNFVGKNQLREILVVSEIALAFVLLTGAGLLLRSFVKMIEIDPGFDARSTLTMNVELPESRYKTPAQMIAFEQQAIERLQSIPGVKAAGSVFGLPLGDMLIRGDFVVENQPAPPADLTPAKILVGGDYFSALGIPVFSGRVFSAHDSQTGPRVVVVSKSLARRLWPTQDPIGRRLKLGFSNDPWCTVVGVVGDTKQNDLRDQSAYALYVPYAQAPRPFLMQSMSLVIRTDSKDQAGSVLAARHAIAAVDPELPLFDVRSMEGLVFRSLSEPRFNTFLLALFAGLALLLAALGTYGVMACAVAARTREIGLRVALGASRAAVLRQILGRVAAIAGIGSSLGILGATLTAHLLGSQLYEVRPIETATYVSVLLLMIASSLLAGYLPARRAARVDPMEALRYE